jgi:hypothetical protein
MPLNYQELYVNVLQTFSVNPAYELADYLLLKLLPFNALLDHPV